MYKSRGGKGIKGMQTIDDDFIEDIVMSTTHNDIYFFTNKGRVYTIKGYKIRKLQELQGVLQ